VVVVARSALFHRHHVTRRLVEQGDPHSIEDGCNPWMAPERFTAKGRDGITDIYGIIVRPSGFDESKSYPVLEHIYAGPQDFYTPKAFSRLRSLREWADEGYVVVKLDGMGTNWRSKEFHDVCFKNLHDGGLPDRIAWIRAAGSTRPWMDLSRVGIQGTSAGGQSAATAALRHGGFYRAAAADSGCHDNRVDKLWWNEQWMGYPVDGSYAASSNTEFVAAGVYSSAAMGQLMLIVGELDDNVDPASTLELARALDEASRDYELVVVPGGTHGCGGSGDALRRQKAFFRQHLLGSAKR
jgi:dipeptidyl-peptidase-4